ncbi:MAG TPA: RluA family pseudouridine synthase [Burkholderiaceae bacterium]|nr:RluA family pseudouridine synthase [Burkholderiaceae bacterium]
MPAIHKAKVETVCVDENSDGQRLDNYLIRELKGVPKTHIYRIIRSGEVRVNKGRSAADTRLQLGDLVRIPPVRVSVQMTPIQGSTRETSQAGRVTVNKTSVHKDLPIIIEDDHLLVVNKPAGNAVHGGSGISLGVIEQMRLARPEAKFLELVHRLDRETSGILLMAKKRSALTNLQNQFRERETGKTYLALVVGDWPVNKKVLDKPLHKYLLKNPDGSEGERRVKVTTKDDPDGMKSVTLVKIRSKFNGFTLLEVTIKTGRTHQIRVHLASEGYPIAGDDKYGDFEVNKSLQKSSSRINFPLKRMFLHAWRLQFTHPTTQERVELCAELPIELQRFTECLSAVT